MKNSNQLVEIPNSQLFNSLVTDLEEALWMEVELLQAVQIFKGSGVRSDLRQSQDLDAERKSHPDFSTDGAKEARDSGF